LKPGEELHEAARVHHRPINAALVADDPFFSTRRNQQVELAARYAVPAIYHEHRRAHAFMNSRRGK
jgi:hypothetical protein